MARITTLPMVMWLSQLWPSLQFTARLLSALKLVNPSDSEVASPSSPRSLEPLSGSVYTTRNGCWPAQGSTGEARFRNKIRPGVSPSSLLPSPRTSATPMGYSVEVSSAYTSLNADAAGMLAGSRALLNSIFTVAPSTVTDCDTGLPPVDLVRVSPSISAAGLPARSRIPPVAGGV